MIVSNKTLIIANENKDRYHHFLEIGCDICPLYDSELEEKILTNGYNYLLFQQHLKSGHKDQLFNSYVFLQKLIEEGRVSNLGEVGIITFQKAVWSGNKKIRTLQSILRPYPFPPDARTWYKHLKVAKANTCDFSYVKEKYNKEWVVPEKQTLQNKLSSFVQGVRKIAAIF
ncbi:MAG: hypothetical protein R3E32_25280 [Chitinophagales bacterium]